MESTKVDFSGQQVYVGIDVAKKSWKVCILVGDLFHRRFSQEPNTAVLVRYLQRNFPGAHYQCVYEAGYCGFWIYWQLRENGIECLVVNPADVPTSDKTRRVKTDPIDAAKLARHLRNHELHSIYIPDQPAQEDRTLVRTRAQFVRKQTRCKNQIKSLLSFYGYTFPEETIERYWSRAYIRWLEGLTLECSSGTQALQSLLKELLFLREMITRMTRQIRVLTHTEPYATRVRLLCSCLASASSRA
jgi:transposase